jgi:spore coat polysaccharide biosynthesis predicted glycosyltransferase SpsG
MIIFRTDANETIATGHLMRCLAIAAECRRHTAVCFVFADDKSTELLKKLCPTWEDYEIEVLHSDYRKLEAELPALQKIIELKKPNAVLIDSYAVTPDYLAAVSRKTCTFYLDDLKAFDYPVDTVINYLDHPEYTPLRAQFRDVPYEVRQEVQNILITTGGSDEAGMSEKILEAALSALTSTVNAKPATLHLVIGILNRHHDHIKERAAADPRIVLHENISEMAALMSKCDLAISAAGSTLCELCAIGVPTICFAVADNQIPNAERLAAKNAVIYAKDQRFAEHIQALANDYPRRRALSTNMRQLIDGYGVVRITEKILEREQDG